MKHPQLGAPGTRNRVRHSKAFIEIGDKSIGA
jgi:hypothetical protein